MNDLGLWAMGIGIPAAAFALFAFAAWRLAGRGALRALLVGTGLLAAILGALAWWLSVAEGYEGLGPILLGVFVWLPASAGWLLAWLVQKVRWRA